MISLGLLRARRTRLWLTTAVMLASVGLSGCYVEGPYSVAKHMRPLSKEMIATLERKGMSKTSPVLIRIFKEESELEVWKQDASGAFALLKTYPMCRWSGQLGPKMREGDRQAPEGFYAITPGAMNPNSSFYLSFNLGYPNAFDRAHGRSGAHLMVHGDCSSRGCYSMTDEQIAEIFALGREAFFAGQKSFQVQAYPFRMTALNMAKHRNSPHLAFWKNLKEGYDHFELTKHEPKVDVCEKRYVFNAGSPPGSTTPLAFQAAGRCPAYQVDPEIASAVAQKKQRDDDEFAGYARRNIAMAPVNTGRDGGMHPYFQKMYETREVRNARGQVTGVVVEARAMSMRDVDAYPREPQIAAATSAPAVEPAAAPVSSGSAGVVANVPMPRPAPGRSRAVASSSDRGSVSAYSASTTSGTTAVGGFFSNLYTSGVSSVSKARDSVAGALGINTQEAKAPPPASKPSQRSRRTTTANSSATPPVPPAKPQQSAPKANDSTRTAQAPAPGSAAAGSSSLVSGAQPVVPAGSFEQRWQGAFR